MADEIDHDAENDSNHNHNSHHSQIQLVQELISNQHNANPSQIRSDKQFDDENSDPMQLIEPHKPRLNTLSGNQHHIVEYHTLSRPKHQTQTPAALSESILNNGNLLITTVDGKFSVLSAEHGQKRMGLDCGNEPLYSSPDAVIPGIDGELYRLRHNDRNEEYLEPLPFSIEQISANQGYADSFNTWYYVEPSNTVFWIDANQWNVCQPVGDIPDFTDNVKEKNTVPLCQSNDNLIVTRIDRQITAVDIDADVPSTKWRFKYGEYRVAIKMNSSQIEQYTASQLQRYQLWQSLDENNKFSLFLYDRDRGEIKWSKSMSSIVTNADFLCSDRQIFNFYVHHIKNTKFDFDDIGLWIVPSANSKNTKIAIAHSDRNPISSHMFLPNAMYNFDDENESENDLKIIDEDIDNINDGIFEKKDIANSNKLRFVPLSFSEPVSTKSEFSAFKQLESWQHTLSNVNSKALKLFNPKQNFLPIPLLRNTENEKIQFSDYRFIEHNFYSFLIAVVFIFYFIPSFKRLFLQKNASKKSKKVSNDGKNSSDWKIIGKLRYNVTKKVGSGRRGVVFCGSFENREVAIKRIDKRLKNAKVENEIDILLKVDSHSNIVRYFAKESDGEFDYIALDLCLCSLHDLIYSNHHLNKEYRGRKVPKKSELAKIGILNPLICVEIEVVNKHKNMSHKRRYFVHDFVKQMCRDCIIGLIALHEAKHGCIIHRDIKPQNILISDEYQCKLADMGMAKIMDSHSQSFDSENIGTIFWNAPELIYKKEPFSSLSSIFDDNEQCDDEYNDDSEYYESSDYENENESENENEWISSSRLTKKVDIFSLGCVISWMLSKGHHPFGDNLLEQQENMESDSPNLSYCQYAVPEAFDLLSFMICVQPNDRICASECLQHPFFWNDAMTLCFIMDFSDYIEKCDKSNGLRVRLELSSKQIIGDDWSKFVDFELLYDANRHRKYKFFSLRDYLRLIRNKWNHFGELHKNLRQKLSDEQNIKSAKKYLHYFTQFTPFLVMHCYKLVAASKHISSFQRYFDQISMQRIEKYSEQVNVCRFRRWIGKH